MLTRNARSEQRSQLFLVFDDGTSFEFCANNDVIAMPGKTDDDCLEEVVRLALNRDGNRVYVFDDQTNEEVQ